VTVERTPDAETEMTAPLLLRRRALAEPDRIPLRDVDGRGLTYGEWEARSSRVAAGLATSGHGPGSVIGLCFAEGDWSEYAVAYQAVLAIGAVALHLSPRLDGDEIRRRIEECAAALLLCSTGAEAAGPVPHTTPAACEIDTGGPLPVLAEPSAPAEILYTSGTTGPAKPIANAHATLAHGHRRTAGRVFDPDRAMLAPMPICTASSASLAGMFALATASPIIVAAPDDTDAIGAALTAGDIGSLMVTPWTARRITETYRGPNGDVASIGIASAPLPPAFARDLAEVFPAAAINTAYAQNEVVPAVVLGQYDPERPLALGRPGPGTEIAVRDTGGEDCSPGVLGEIWMRHTAVRRRWRWGQTPPDAPGEWIGTGDFGHLDAEGTLHLFDRGGDRMATANGPVSSIAIENALYDHPGVREAAAFRADDAIVAVVAGTVADLAAVEARLKEGVLSGIDDRIEVVAHDALPRGVTGKVLKARLRGRAQL
jgi:fatty-acyl-CoA synthase